MSDLLGAFGLGVVSQSSLLLAGVVACWIVVPQRAIGVLAGLGAGLMIAAVAFDLVAEAEDLAFWEFGLFMLAGAAVFELADRIFDRRFGDTGESGAIGIVVGSVVDGVPESIILGIQFTAGLPISAAFVAAVLVSNIPQSLAPSADLAAAGWGAARLARLWSGVVVACGVAAALGFVLADLNSAFQGQAMAAVAAGGLLAMLSNSLMPFAYDRGGDLAGFATVIGFCLALIGS